MRSYHREELRLEFELELDADFEPMLAPADDPSRLLSCGSHNACNRSRVVHKLALRPGFSAQARMPPTVRPAPRRERRGLLVLTAGQVPCS